MAFVINLQRIGRGDENSDGFWRSEEREDSKRILCSHGFSASENGRDLWNNGVGVGAEEDASDASSSSRLDQSVPRRDDLSRIAVGHLLHLVGRKLLNR